MPFGGLLTAGIIGGSSLLGGIAGASNTRPPSLDPTQRSSLDQLIQGLMPQAQGTPKIDPVQQQLLYGQNAMSLTGANNQATHALSSRGLGTSGLLAQALMQNANQSQSNQNNINLGLQQQAVQQKQLSIQDLMGLLNVNNTPGQSGFGGFMAGLAPILAYSIQNMSNQNGLAGMGGAPGTVPGLGAGYTPPFLGAP